MKSRESQIHQWINSHRQKLADVLCELIRIESINPWFYDYAKDRPSGEEGVQRLIAQRLKDLGFNVEMWEPDWRELVKYEGRSGFYRGREFVGRPNLYANYPGSGGGKSLMLTGHVDVVQVEGEWEHPPFAGTIVDDRVYGRGAVDMKGGIACMLLASEAVIASGAKLKGDIRFGLVSDEEAGGMGSLDFMEKGCQDSRYRADGAIMMEPTDMIVSPMCRGILWGKLTIPGRSGHIEIKQGDWRDGGAVDAIDLARMYLNAIEFKNKEWSTDPRKNHPLIPIPCRINIAQINAGSYPTAYADHCDIVFNIQYLPEERDENLLGGKVKQEFAEFVSCIAASNDWLQEHPPTIEWLIDADCSETSVDSDFVRAFLDCGKSNAQPMKVEGVHCHTDMGYFCNAGIPTINFGAGQSKLAHQKDEWINIDEMVEATKLIASMILHWCDEEEM